MRSNSSTAFISKQHFWQSECQIGCKHVLINERHVRHSFYFEKFIWQFQHDRSTCYVRKRHISETEMSDIVFQWDSWFLLVSTEHIWAKILLKNKMKNVIGFFFLFKYFIAFI